MPKSTEAIFGQMLKSGGQRMRAVCSADIYERRGTALDHVGRPEAVRGLLSNRIKLPHILRGIGNIYGASVEELRIGLSGEFLAEAVDGGKSPSGGGSEYLVDLRQRVTVARDGVRALNVLRHPIKAPLADIKAGKVGPHKSMTHLALVDAVCCQGADISEVALRFGWWSIRDGVKVVPKRQSQKLKAGLVDGLEAIEAAWAGVGIDVLKIIGGMEIG